MKPILTAAWLGWALQAAAQVSGPATPPAPPSAVSTPATPAACAPGASSAESKACTAVRRYTLANGMAVIVKPDHRAPTAIHMVLVRVGSMDEVDGTSGVAHAVEHMMFKGTSTLKPGDFSRKVAALGGRENAFTTRDYTGYYQQIPVEKLADVMALESDRFAGNRWDDDEFKREIEVIKEERRMRTDDSPRAQLGEAQMAAVYNASPYRRPVIGWMNDLDAMTPDDVRGFYRRWYTPANAALVVVGDVDPDQVLALAQRHYGGIPAAPVPVSKPRVEPQQTGIRQLSVKAPAEQAYVQLAFKVPRLDPRDLETPLDQPLKPAATDALSLTVLSAVLDGYSGARLFRALTQGSNRLADSADASNGLIGRGPQLFMLSGVPAPGKSTAALRDALREQVAKIAKDGVSEAELNRVKTQWIAGEVYQLDSVMNQARELGNYWIWEQPLDSGERLIERLKRITPAQVQDVAARYFGDDQLTVADLIPQPIDKNKKPRTPPPGSRH